MRKNADKSRDPGRAGRSHGAGPFFAPGLAYVPAVYLGGAVCLALLLLAIAARAA